MISIIGIFKKSFKSYFVNNNEWMRSIFTPIFLSVFSGNILLFTHLYYEKPLITILDFNDLSLLELVILIFYNIVSIFAGAIFFINLYRHGVLKEGGDKFWNMPPLRRILRLISYMIPLYAVIFLIYLISTVLLNGSLLGINLGWLNLLLGVSFILLGIYLIIRVFLMLLLVSIDHQTPLRTSWKLLQGNVFPAFSLIALSLISALIIASPGLLLINYFGGFTMVLSSVYIALPVFGIFLGTIYLMFLIISSNALAILYMQLSDRK